MTRYYDILCADGPRAGTHVPSIGIPRYNSFVQLNRPARKHRRPKTDIYVVRQEPDHAPARAYYVGTLGKPWKP